MSKKINQSMKLFTIFFKLGLFAFGGGYSIIPLIESEVVEKEKIVKREEFLDIIAVVQGLPGAIGLNTAIFVGYMVNRYVGVILCAAGSILPSVLLVSAIMMLFNGISNNPIVQQAFYGVRPVVVALIAYAAIKIGKSAYKYKWHLIFTIIGFYLALEKVVEIPVLVIGGLILGIILNIIEVQYKKYFKCNINNTFKHGEGGVK